MHMLRSAGVIDIISNALNYVEPKLANHGKRVAYIAYKMLRRQSEIEEKYTEKQIRDICVLALLHDIGAYKTEDIARMISFETEDVWAHSVYGYFFLKYFSPLKAIAPAVLYHHADCARVKDIDDALQEIAQIISVADRADIFSQLGLSGKSKFVDFFERKRDVTFRSDIIDLLLSSGVELPFREDVIDKDAEYNSLFYGMGFTEEEAEAYLRMTVLSIEFRSPQTANHTIVMSHIGTLAARALAMDDDEAYGIYIGSMLHDLGKVGIPVEILEKPGRLTSQEFKMMKLHVDMTKTILRGNIDGEIEKIALRHHEKLDGSGYPNGLTGDDLTVKDRLVAVADIFSALCSIRSYKEPFPKGKIVSVLSDMGEKNLIDNGIVSWFITNIDYLLSEAEKVSLPIFKMYVKINDEYIRLKSRLENIT